MIKGGSSKKIIDLVCPNCKKKLEERTSGLYCNTCCKNFPIMHEIPSFIESDKKQLTFYDEWHKKIELLWNVKLHEKRKYFYPYKLINYLRQHMILRKIILNLCYFEGRKELFFRNAFRKGPKGLVLDVGCGKGYNIYTTIGTVVGIDLSLYSILEAKKTSIYESLIHGDVTNLPFKDEQFDYIVSSDLIEHIPTHSKTNFYHELYRVLKKGGKMAHIVTTDSKNIWFRFAHKYPELFHKYLIEEIGGHYGLETATSFLQEIERLGFILLYRKKMLWDTQEYVLRFDNEYKYKSFFIRIWVILCKIILSNEMLNILLNIPLGIVTRIIEKCIPLDHSQSIAVIYKK